MRTDPIARREKASSAFPSRVLVALEDESASLALRNKNLMVLLGNHICSSPIDEKRHALPGAS